VTKCGILLPDTNTILRYLLKDDFGQYAQAEAVFDAVRLGQKQAVIMDGVVLECLYVMTKYYKVPRQEAAESLGGMLGYRGIRNENREELTAALERFAATRLDFMDCLLAETAKSRKMDIFTFDEGLRKEEGT
jgi:predicted nucleic-acid-binding protein